MTTLEINAKPKEPINLKLVGKEYRVFPPKTIQSLLLAQAGRGSKKDGSDSDPMKMYDEVKKWITMAFGRKEAPKVIARMEDPNDELDLDHIMELMEKLMEQSTGNPTS